MSEQTGQGAAGTGPGDAGDTDDADEGAAVRTEGERMARRLVQDVAAYEVDPPPPARAAEDADRAGDDPDGPAPGR